MAANENFLNSLTPKQLQMMTALAEQPEIATQLVIAMLQGDTLTFTLTLAGLQKGRAEIVNYFRTAREFLNLPEVVESLA